MYKVEPYNTDIDDIGLGTGREPHWISLAHVSRDDRQGIYKHKTGSN